VKAPNLGIVASVVSAVAALITLGIVLIQLWLMRRQTRAMEDQLALMNRQDAILQRRSNLVANTKTAVVGNAVTVEVRARNEGNKTASDFYWHISIPRAVGVGVEDFQCAEGVVTPLDITIGGVPYWHWSAVRRDPLYPKRGTVLARFQVERARAAAGFDVVWQMTAEDGMFPDDDKSGTLTVRV